MIPSDLNKEDSIDWAMNQLTEEYLAGRIVAVVWGIVAKDGTLTTTWSNGHFLERMGLAAVMLQNMNAEVPSERTDMPGEDEDEEGG